MAKQIISGEEARNKLASGVRQVAGATKITLGPRGRNVILQKPYGGPRITNDGVSIAKEISLPDPFENLGADIVKEVSEKTNMGAGDGTTTSIVILEALITGGLPFVMKGTNAMAIRKGMEKARDLAVLEIKAIAKPLVSRADIKKIASISVESEVIGETITEVVERVGRTGVVTVEESQGTEISYDIVEGMKTDKGYLSPYMVTNPETMEAIVNDAYILITDRVLSLTEEVLPALEVIAKTGKKEVVVIAENVEGDCLNTFVLNKVRGHFNILATKAPGFGEGKKATLQDIALLTGGTLMSDETGKTFKSMTIEDFGRADKVVSTKESTIIVGGKGEKETIEARVESLKVALGKADGKFDKEALEQRIAKLTSGVAVIRVGASTETEMKYLKDKIEDAVRATKASLEEGIVPGGGSALAKIALSIGVVEEGATPSELSDAEKIGFNLVAEALTAPIAQIMINAGKKDVALGVHRVQEGAKNYGYDASSGDYVDDMVKAGIVDPAKVARLAIENAVSAAAILLTTEVAVADIPAKAPAEML